MTHSAPGSSPEVLENQISDILAGLGFREFRLVSLSLSLEGLGLSGSFNGSFTASFGVPEVFSSRDGCVYRGLGLGFWFSCQCTHGENITAHVKPLENPVRSPKRPCTNKPFFGSEPRKSETLNPESPKYPGLGLGVLGWGWDL